MTIQTTRRCKGCRTFFETKSSFVTVCRACQVVGPLYATPAGFDDAQRAYQLARTLFVKPCPVVKFPKLYVTRRDA